MNRIKTPIIIVIGLVGFTLTSDIYAAGFDCAKASTLVENVIALMMKYQRLMTRYRPLIVMP